MKTEEERPYLAKTGWLYAGKHVKWSNSPAINTNVCKSFCYYQETNSEGKRKNSWYIVFDEKFKWYYDSEEEMGKDYFIIAQLLAGETPEESKEYI